TRTQMVKLPSGMYYIIPDRQEMLKKMSYDYYKYEWENAKEQCGYVYSTEGYESTLHVPKYRLPSLLDRGPSALSVEDVRAISQRGNNYAPGAAPEDVVGSGTITEKQKNFSRLVAGEWGVTGPRDESYNCLAWTLGDTKHYYWWTQRNPTIAEMTA